MLEVLGWRVAGWLEGRKDRRPRERLPRLAGWLGLGCV